MIVTKQMLIFDQKRQGRKVLRDVQAMVPRNGYTVQCPETRQPAHHCAMRRPALSANKWPASKPRNCQIVSCQVSSGRSVPGDVSRTYSTKETVCAYCQQCQQTARWLYSIQCMIVGRVWWLATATLFCAKRRPDVQCRESVTPFDRHGLQTVLC